MATFEFNEANYNLDGGWLGGSNKDLVAKKAPKEANSVEVSKPSGLGFSRQKDRRDLLGSKKAPTMNQSKKGVTDVDAAKAGEDDEEEDEELHGVVEEAGLSRTNMASKQKIEVTKGESKKSKKKRKKRMEQELVAEGTTVESSSADPAPPAAGWEEGETEEGQAKKKSKKGYWGELTALPIEVVDGEVVKRKRKKTRSKQKNIRKDSRPDDEKPNYRPLTSATLTKMAKRH